MKIREPRRKSITTYFLSLPGSWYDVVGSQQQKSAVPTSHTLYPLNNAAVIELRRGYQLGELHKSAPLCASSHAWKYLFTLRNTAETECVIQGRQL